MFPYRFLVCVGPGKLKRLENICWKHVFRYLGLWGFLIQEEHCFQGFRTPDFQGFRKPGVQGFRTPGFQGFRKPDFQGFRSPGFHAILSI